MTALLVPRLTRRSAKLLPSTVSGNVLWLRGDTNIQIGGARDLNGTNQTFSRPGFSAVAFATEDFSGAMAVSRDTTGNEVIWSKFVDASNYTALSFQTDNTLRLIAIVGGVTKIDLNGTTAITDTNWHAISWSVDRDSPSNTKLFLDGMDNTSGTPIVSTDTVVDAGTFFFVGEFGDSSAFFNGQIASLHIAKNYLFTAADHAAAFNGGNSSVLNGLPLALRSQITASWSFNEQSGNAIDAKSTNDLTANNSPAAADGPTVQIAEDSSTNGNYGTLQSFPAGAAHWSVSTAQSTLDVTAKEDDNDNHGALIGFVSGDSPRITNTPLGGRAIQLDRDKSQYVNCGNVTEANFGTGNFTVSFWARWTFSTGGIYGDVIMKDNGGGANNGLYIGFSANDADQMGYWNGSVQQDFGSGLNDGTWRHFAFVRSGTGANQLACYIDGAVQSPLMTDSRTLSNSLNLQIGASNTPGDYWPGDIDRVELYNTNLSAAEVLYLAKNPIGESGGTNPGTGSRVFKMDFDEPNSRDVATLQNGFSLETDGTNDYVDVGNIGGGVKTICFWFKPDDITTRELINCDGTDKIELNGSGNVVATSFPGTTKVYVDAVERAGPLVAGRWHFIAVTDTTGVTCSAFEIGRAGGVNQADGMFDDVRAYTDAKTQAELYLLYTGTDNTANLVLRHKYDDGPQTVPVDGDPVLGWIGRGDNRVQFNQNTASKRGIYRTGASGINNRGCVEFDGTDDLYVCDTVLTGLQHIALSGETGSTAFSGDQFIFAISDTAAANDYFGVGVDSAGKVFIRSVEGGTTNEVTGNTVLTTSQKFIVEAKTEGGVWVLKVNGTVQTLSVDAGSNTGLMNPAGADNITLGALKHTSETGHFEGKMGEGSGFDQDISTLNETKHLAYLGTRYNISI